jgi:hypothetical protein
MEYYPMRSSIFVAAVVLSLGTGGAHAQTSQGSSPLSIAKGGTGGITAAAARVNLGFAATANRLYGTDGSGVSTVVTLPAAGLTLSAGALAFANDLAALEGLGSTGIARRTGTDAWSVGSAVSNAELATMPAFTFKGNNTSGTATPTDVNIAALTTKASPAASDYVILSDQAAAGAWKKATVSSVGSAGSVSSIDGNTGAFTLSGGITNSANDIRLSLTNATLNGQPSNPSSTGSAAGVMMGLGVTTCRITPVYSGRVFAVIDGSVSNNSVGQLTSFNLRVGTGAGPANGAAATGTPVTTSTSTGNGGATYQAGFSKSAIITGLTPGVAIWLDMSLAATGGTSTMAGIGCTAYEF